jgi:hypothetical protein
MNSLGFIIVLRAIVQANDQIVQKLLQLRNVFLGAQGFQRLNGRDAHEGSLVLARSDQRAYRPRVADLAQRPGGMIVDVRVPEQRNEDVDTAAFPELAKHMDCVISVRPNLISHPPARFCEVRSSPRDPLTERPVGSVRQDAPDGGWTPRITKAREDKRRVRPDVSIDVAQQRLQRNEHSSVPSSSTAPTSPSRRGREPSARRDWTPRGLRRLQRGVRRSSH